MKTIGIREFRANMSRYLRELPILISFKDKPRYKVIKLKENSQESRKVPKPLEPKPVVNGKCQRNLLNDKPCPRDAKLMVNISGYDPDTSKKQSKDIRVCGTCFNRLQALSEELGDFTLRRLDDGN
jgi:hypothetical protein